MATYKLHWDAREKLSLSHTKKKDKNAEGARAADEQKVLKTRHTGIILEAALER